MTETSTPHLDAPDVAQILTGLAGEALVIRDLFVKQLVEVKHASVDERFGVFLFDQGRLLAQLGLIQRG